MDNNYDKRQLELMKERIMLFQKGSIPLQILVDDIGSLIDVLEDIESNWKDECRSFWWDLEQVYAVALDRDKTTLDEKGVEIISEALDKLYSHIDILLNYNLD